MDTFLLRRLKRDNKGLAIIEFALLSPVMLFLICGTIEIGHMIFARVMLEGAVTEAARVATASLETAESARTAEMKASIKTTMQQFPTAAGTELTITTAVYRNFSAAYPEPYSDANADGDYDFGEPFSDRNKDGVWNDATPVAGSTLGGPGDVVSYTAHFPKASLFGFVSGIVGFKGGVIPLEATTVVRNEAVARRT